MGSVPDFDAVGTGIQTVKELNKHERGLEPTEIELLPWHDIRSV